MNRNRAHSLISGAILIVLGILFALKALGIMTFNIFFDGWWTLFIIIPCLMSMVKKGPAMSNLIGLGIGVFLLLVAQGVVGFALFWKLLWPAIFILIGLRLIFRETFDKTVAFIRGENSQNSKEYTAVFGEQKADLSGEEFHGAQIDAVFGGVTLNLRNAKIEKDAVIDVTCVFGGATIILPDNVKVKVSSTPIFGGVSNKKVPAFTADAPTVYINATCLFGGADIQ